MKGEKTIIGARMVGQIAIFHFSFCLFGMFVGYKTKGPVAIFRRSTSSVKSTPAMMP